ncbi:MAG: YbaB/EbfC family nucleoid-associated protein, partial [Erysipelotrichaceae bacterium]|nr:YbaB/EbfC family nucleoid-associated protein [Erysipelotrichaceae bacterium]
MDDAEMVADSVMMAVNKALAEAKKDRENQMGKLTQGVKMPGMF